MIPLPLPYTASLTTGIVVGIVFLCVSNVLFSLFSVASGLLLPNGYCMLRANKDRTRSKSWTTEDRIRLEYGYANQAVASSLSQCSAVMNDAHFRAACFAGMRVSGGNDTEE